jgi:hypothetical protein
MQIQTVASAPTSLPTEQAIEHFHKITQRFLKEYKASNLETKSNVKSIRYEAEGAQISHVIDTMIRKDEKGFKYGFLNGKKANVVKDVKDYYEEEIDLQADAFKELVSRLIVLGDSYYEKEVIYFNTIEDVKQKILALQDERSRLTIDEEIIDKQVFLSLKSQNEVIALFSLTINKDTNSNDYFIDIQFTISKDKKESSDSVRINMFEKDKSQFDISMSPITKNLEMKKYINNLNEAVIDFQKFMKNYFEYISLTEASNVSPSLVKKVFKLTFEKQSADVEIVYIPPVHGGEYKVGSYQITVLRDGSKFSEIKFQRMTIKAYEEYLKALGLDKLFEDLWTKIKRIFMEKFIRKYETTYPDTFFTESSKNVNMFFTKEILYTARYLKTDVMSISHIIDGEKWTLKWQADRPEMKELRLVFTKESFSTPILENFFDMILDSHSSLVNKSKNVLL